MKETAIVVWVAYLSWTILLVGAVSTLTSCSAAKYAFNCTVTQPENCN
jgi:hypothetical protein